MVSDANIFVPYLAQAPRPPEYQLEVVKFGNLTASAKIEQIGNIRLY